MVEDGVGHLESVLLEAVIKLEAIEVLRVELQLELQPA
jgi:hypothetical protein